MIVVDGAAVFRVTEAPKRMVQSLRAAQLILRSSFYQPLFNLVNLVLNLPATT